MEKQHINKRLLKLLFVLLFTLSTLYAFCIDALKPSPLPVLDVKVDPVYDTIFMPEKRGFLGADGGASVQLSPNRILWVFGDTILGTVRDGERKGTIIRNSIAIQKLSGEGAGTITYYWDLTDRIPGAFFHPDSFHEPYWFWPGTGITINGKTYLFMFKVGSGEGLGGVEFKGIGCVLVRIHNPLDSPEEWRMSMVDLPYGDDHFNITAGCLTEGDYVYLLGYDDGPDDKPLERRAILARLPIKKLDSHEPGESIQFWSQGDQWQPTPGNCTALFKPGTTESFLYYDKNLKRYITSVIAPFSPDYYLVSAENLTGPWSEPQKIYHIPDLQKNEHYHAYASRGHPMLPCESNELVLSYVVNTTDFWHLFSVTDIYYPRFIRVRFDSSDN